MNNNTCLTKHLFPVHMRRRRRGRHPARGLAPRRREEFDRDSGPGPSRFPSGEGIRIIAIIISNDNTSSNDCNDCLGVAAGGPSAADLPESAAGKGPCCHPVVDSARWPGAGDLPAAGLAVPSLGLRLRCSGCLARFACLHAQKHSQLLYYTIVYYTIV